jgi:putative DNA primase/helicase
MAQVHTHHEQLIEAKAIIETLFASGHLTPEQVFTPAILQAMGWIQTLDPAAAAIIKSRFKRAKISLRDLDKSLKSYQPRLLRVVEEAETPPLRTARDCLSDAPLPTLVIPDPFSLQDDATVRLIEDEMTGQHDAQAIAFAPILITGRLENIDDPGQWLRLEWKRGTKWHRYDADRGQALNAQKLLDLASQGFPVASENVAHVAQYLHHLEAANYHTIPAARMATRLGWQGPLGAHGFLCGRTLARDDEMLVIDDLTSVPTTAWQENWISFHGAAVGDDQLVNGFHARGTYEGWCEAIKTVLPYPKVRLGLFASLATPLLEILKIPNFVVDWSARTSAGKTTTLRVIASPWGCPDERRPGESIVHSWNATKVWSERAAAVLNGLPFILDESRLAAKGVVSETLYLVANGIGKGRGVPRGLGSKKRWRTILFSTGESPATSFSEDGGARMRCLCVRGYPFGAINGQLMKTVGELTSALIMHYGHAGPRFAQWILQHRDQWPQWERKYTIFKAQYIGTVQDPAAYRLSDYAAVIALAADLAQDALGLSWGTGRIIPDDLWSAIVQEASGAAGDVRALQDLMAWSYSHQESFYGRQVMERDGTPRAPSIGWSGKWDKGEHWTEIAFSPLVLKRILHDCGYDPEAIVSLWKENGWLLRDAGSKHLGKLTSIPGGERPRYLTFTRATVDECDER